MYLETPPARRVEYSIPRARLADHTSSAGPRLTSLELSDEALTWGYFHPFLPEEMLCQSSWALLGIPRSVQTRWLARFSGEEIVNSWGGTRGPSRTEGTAVTSTSSTCRPSDILADWLCYADDDTPMLYHPWLVVEAVSTGWILYALDTHHKPAPEECNPEPVFIDARGRLLGPTTETTLRIREALVGQRLA